VLPIILSTACEFSELTTDFASWGTCFTSTALFGVPELMSIILAGFFIFLWARYGVPASVALTSSTVMFYLFELMTPSPVFFGLFVCNVAVLGVVLAGSLLKFVSRR